MSSTDRIFSGEYSRKMWDEINEATDVESLKDALYLVGCRLQEFESKVFPAADNISSEISSIQNSILKLRERIKVDTSIEREYFKLLALKRVGEAANKLDKVTDFIKAGQQRRG